MLMTTPSMFITYLTGESVGQTESSSVSGVAGILLALIRAHNYRRAPLYPPQLLSLPLCCQEQRSPAAAGAAQREWSSHRRALPS